MELKPRQPLRRLQWRLTLQFTLASMLTTLLVQMIGFGLLAFTLVHYTDAAHEVKKEVERQMRGVLRYFPNGTLDRAAAQEWLDDQVAANALEDLFRFNTGAAIISFNTVQTDQVTVAMVDTNGIVQISAPKSSRYKPDKPIAAALSPNELLLYEAARAGETVAAKMNSTIVVVAPVRRAGKLLAVVFVKTKTLLGGTWEELNRSAFWSVFTSSLLPELLWSGFWAGIAGGIVGWMTARRMIRRLTAISLAADSWARGELDAVAPEQPADEIGLLARRLNRMTQDLRQVIALRNEVSALEERQRITRDLHDTVKQQAFATSMMIGSAQEQIRRNDSVGLKRALTEAASLSRQVQTELSGILTRARGGQPTTLTRQLERIAADWERRAGVQITVQTPPNEGTIPATTIQEAVRITEEAVANAVKHSGSGTIRILLDTVSDVPRTLCLSVSDVGKGFDSEKPKGNGMGLVTMAERAAMLPQGRLSVVSAPGQGTAVRLYFGG